MADDDKNAGGRPEWVPTDIEKGRIQGYAEAGFTQEQIARRIGVDRQTLVKHCNDILEFARMDLLVGVVRNAYRAALGAPAQYDQDKNMVRAEVVPQAWAICFILKTIGRKLGLGFSERLEIGRPDDQQQIELAALLPKMSEDEIAVIHQAQGIIGKYAPSLAGPRGDGETAH